MTRSRGALVSPATAASIASFRSCGSMPEAGRLLRLPGRVRIVGAGTGSRRCLGGGSESAGKQEGPEQQAAARSDHDVSSPAPEWLGAAPERVTLLDRALRQAGRGARDGIFVPALCGCATMM